MLIGRQKPERNVAVGGAGDTTGGDGPDAVTVEPELQQEGGREGEVPPGRVVVALQEWSKVDLVLDQIADEAGEVIVWEPVTQIQWKEEVLVGLLSSEVGLRSAGHDRP